MNSAFRALIEIGITELDDPTSLRTERTWYRNGERGSLHINRNCYKLKTWESQSLELTYAQAAKKRHCSYCCDERAVPGGHASTLRVLQSALGIMADFDRKATEAKFAQDLGALVETLKETADTLKALDENMRDTVSAALERIEKRLSLGHQQVVELKKTIAEGVIPWAASRLMLSPVAGEDRFDRSMRNLYGYHGEKPRYGEAAYQIDHIYSAWVKGRRLSRERADEKAFEQLKEAKLTYLAQLDFPAEELGQATLLESAQELWETQIHRVLTENLIPAWDKEWTTNASMTTLRTVGIAGGEFTQSATTGLWQIFASHRNVAVVPEVVAAWLVRNEMRYGNRIAWTADACSEEQLQTVAALWDPGDRHSVYQTLQAAVDVATQL